MYLRVQMSLDEFKEDVTRKVWRNKNGSKIMCVSGILDETEYNLSIKREKDKVIIKCTPTS